MFANRRERSTFMVDRSDLSMMIERDTAASHLVLDGLTLAVDRKGRPLHPHVQAGR